MNPWIGILIVLTALAGAFISTRLIERFLAPDPEVLRKLIHVEMGLVTVTFPWLFDRSWPVLLLALVSVSALTLLRRGLSLTRSLRGLLHGVERTSWGEMLFPISVALVFILADGDPLLYCVPILVLALADAVAALIGVYYGQNQFTTLEGNKSVEGSVAFFIVTFLCVHVSLLLFTVTGRVECLLIGLLMGVIIMMFEALAWHGLDNLFIPLATYALLNSYLEMDVAALTLSLVVIILLGALLWLWRRHSTMDASAQMGAGLFAYAAWSIGGMYWLGIPMLFFVLTMWFARQVRRQGRGNIHNVYALLGVTGPALFWLLLDDHQGGCNPLFAYTIVFACHITMLTISHAHYQLSRLPAGIMGAAVIAGMMPVFLFCLELTVFDLKLLQVLAVSCLVLVLSGLLFLRLQPQLDNCPVTPERWLRQAGIAGGVSLLGWLALLITPGELS
ncbi:hypothetical protein [Gynuella sp.]|uniref:hypothetical protein n=1 Tax=Gynuella sp. TaxID=2969146 RepID=UPI003D151968